MPLSAKIEVTDVVTVRESVEIIVYDKDGRIKAHYKSEDDSERDLKQNHRNSDKTSSVNIEWFFEEYKEEPVISVCEKCLRIIKDIVNEAKQKFG